jgi:7-carboxy-7-deazaguanine synthase
LESGTKMSVGQVLLEVNKPRINLVEITGGEPLLQKETVTLCKELLQSKYSVMVETNGTQDIGVIPCEVKRIVDIKCPGSGAGGSFLAGNINCLTKNDEVKFVVSSVEDAEWAKDFCIKHDLTKKCTVIFSPAAMTFSPKMLAGWLIENRFEVRLGIQLHKVIWGDIRGK